MSGERETILGPEDVGVGDLFKTIWWVLVLAVLLASALLYWRLGDFTPQTRADQIAATGFALEPCLLADGALFPAAHPHSIQPLNEPATLTREEAKEFKIGARGKFLVPGDFVIGVRVEGQACAYPVRYLEWHEVVNHTFNGRPLAITWHALSGAAVVFDRRVEGEAEALRFESSGLLFNSTLLLGDQTSDGRPGSVWSQLQARAVAGPAAAQGRRLGIVPSQLARWADWQEAYPETRVMAPDMSKQKLYKRDPYLSYLGSDMLRFPVDPLPPEGLPNKERTLVVRAGGERVVYPLSTIAPRCVEGQAWRTTQAGVTLEFRYHPNHPYPETATVFAPGGEAIEVIPVFWFAWYATHPDDARLAK